MIEVLKSYLMFGLIENVIIFMWFKWIEKENGVKWIHLIPISIGSIVCWLFTIPFAKQILGILMFVAYLTKVSERKTIDLFKITIKPMMYLLCIEIISYITFGIFTDLEIKEMCLLDKFIIFIPIRIVEVLILIIYLNRRNIYGLLVGRRD